MKTNNALIFRGLLVFLILLIGLTSILASEFNILINATSNSGYANDGVGCTGIGDATSVGYYKYNVGTSSFQEGYEFRSFFEFNTSFVGEFGTTSVVNLSLYLQAVIGILPGEEGIVYQCNYGTLDVTDFEMEVGSSEGTIFDSNSVTEQRYSLNITPSYINKTGMTQFCLRDNFACADGDKRWLNNDVSEAIQLNITYTDTCTPPESGNYAVDASDGCVWDTNDIIPGNVTITGTGIVRLSANWTFNGTGQYINIGSGGTFLTESGGSING